MTPRERAMAAYLAAYEKGHEDWERLQAAMLANHPKLGWDSWDREIRFRHPNKPIFGYRIPLGVVLGVVGAEGYGWHSINSPRTMKSQKLYQVYREQVINRGRELAGLEFVGQASMPFL